MNKYAWYTNPSSPYRPVNAAVVNMQESKWYGNDLLHLVELMWKLNITVFW